MTLFPSTSLRSWIPLLCAGLLVLLAGPAAAQTPAATIEDDGGTVVLESYADGALLAPGTFNTGTIPTTGAGTRLMWHPAKAAFRAGQVNGSQWDNVGKHSVALGLDTRATGEQTIALGDGATASANNAVALGFDTAANGFNTTAMGNNTTANGGIAATMGYFTVADTDRSLTIGEYNDRNRGNDDNLNSTGPLFVVGNGSSGSRSDALVLEQSGNLITSSTSTFSDRRLKTAIEPLGDGTLKKLADVRPVRYEFKNQNTHPAGEQIGLIAQDVQKAFPELVSGEDDEHLSLSYSKFTAVLLKGLQEQQTQIDRQRATIDSLRERVQDIEDVKKRLAIVEARQEAGASRAAGWTGGPIGLLLAALLGGLVTAGVLRFRT